MGYKSEMPRHIEQRGHGWWYAILNVPRGVQRKLGRKRFLQALNTRDPKVAQRKASLLIADWKGEIDDARGKPKGDNARAWYNALQRAKTPEDKLNAEAQRYRDALRRAKTPADRLNVETDMETHVAMQGYDNSDPEAQRFYGQALGSIIATTEHLDEWIGSLQVKDKTAGMRRATVKRLGDRFPTLQDISRKEVRRWVTDLVAELKPATVQRMTSDCRSYWRYLATIEAVPEDSAPFDRLGLKVKQSSWLPYTPKEAVRLLNAAEGDGQLADVIRLAMYTGARREELCSLKIEHVAKDRFEIVDAKTEAGIRTVPIHRQLVKTIKRLVKDSKDDYMLSGLKPNKNGDRGDALGKRFTRLKTELGFDDRHVFHSFRGTVITMLERAGVPEGTVQDIIGHDRSTLTGSTYSGKSTIEMRRDALAKLRYPAA